MLKIIKNNLLYIVVPLILAMFVTQLIAMRSDSATTDEAVHIAAGYTYWTQNKYYFDPEHPPLAKRIAALPLLFMNELKLPPLGQRWAEAQNFFYDSWKQARSFGDDFFYKMGNDPAKMLFAARLPLMIIVTLFGLFIWWVTKRMYGVWAAVLALFLYCFDPNILAHGRLANNDALLACVYFAACYFFGKFLIKNNWVNFILAAVFLGITISTKFTGLIIILSLLSMVIINSLWQRDQKQSTRTWYNIKYFLLLIVISYLIIWMMYGFTTDHMPQFLGVRLDYYQQSYLFKNAVTNLFNTLRKVLVPAYFYKGIVMVMVHSVAGHSSFLMGQHSRSGWWYYFPIAILIKTPITLLILLFSRIIIQVIYKIKFVLLDYFLLVPAIVFLAVAILSHSDLGIRHILPIYPFIIVWSAGVISLIDKEKNFGNKSYIAYIGIIILVLFQMISVLKVYPYHLSYFNELIGGPKNGYKYLTDSNLDWGQDAIRIQEFIKQNNITNFNLDYAWGDAQANYYFGQNYHKLTADDQDIKGWVIISATALQSEPTQNGNDYGWLKVRKPYARIGDSTFVYYLPE